MRDQAEHLRQLMTLRQAEPESAPEGPPVLIVGSGKGGVGKSVVSVMLAAAMAQDGRKVLLLDGAQNMGNLHVLLGVRPIARLEELLTGEAAATDLLVPVTENLWLLPSDSGTESLYALAAVDQARLHYRLSALYDEFDAVVVDAGPGLEGVVRLATMRGTRLVVVTMPEPAAITDAYALIKIVSLQLPGLPVDLLANRTWTAEEGQMTYDRLATACQRFLGREIRYLGAIPEDEAMRLAVRDPRHLLTPGADQLAASAIRAIAADRFDLPARLAT